MPPAAVSPLPPARPSLRARASSLWPLALLCGLVLCLYLPTVHFEFLNWDDGWYVTRNELITSWSPTNLYRIATEVVARNFAPVTIFTLLVEHTLFGDWAGGYHIVNLLLHAGNAVLVYWLLRQLTNNFTLSLLVAALFAAHPAQVESVAWVSSCKTLLSAGFTLLSLLCWLRPERTHCQAVWGTLWLGLALLSRASAVTMPLIVIAYDWLVVRKPLKQSIARQFVPLLCCGWLLLSTMSAQVAYWGGLRDHLSLSKPEILAVDTTILMRYAGTLLWPQDLCVLYDVPYQNITGLIVCSTLGWLAIGVCLWSIRHRAPLATVAGIAWIAMFLPVINLFPLTTLMNDRYLYLTCVPFFAVLIGCVQWAMAEIVKRVPQWRVAMSSSSVLAAVLTVAFFAQATHRYLPVWRNPVTLWSHAREVSGELALVQIQWALTLEQQDRDQEAAGALRHALTHCRPDEGDRARIEKILARVDGTSTR